MANRILWVVALGVGLGWLSVVRAGEGGGRFELTEAERVWLTANPEFRVGVMADFPPLEYTDREGNPAGLGADLLAEMNQRLGGVIRLRSGAFSQLLAEAKAGKLDGLMDLVPGTGHDRDFEFTRSYLEVPAVIVAKRDARYYRTVQMLAGNTLALERDYALAAWFKENQPKVRLRLYDCTKDALDGVARGEAVAYAGNRAVGLYLLDREMLSNLHLQGRLDDAPSALCLGVRKDQAEWTALLDRALEDVLQTQGRSLRARWFDRASRAGSRFAPGPEEQAWLESHPVIRVGIPGDAPPMADVDEAGKPGGLAGDLLELLNERLDGRLAAVAGPRAQLEEDLRSGRLDALMDMASGAGTGGELLYTNPYANIPNVIVGRKGGAPLVTLESLNSCTVAAAAGFPAAGHLRRERPQVRVTEYPTVREALAAVSDGRADAFVGSRALASWALARDLLVDLQIQGTAWEVESVVGIGVRKDQPVLAALLDAALAALPADDVQGIYERWVGAGWHQMVELSWIQLSPQEKKWLEEHPVIRVGSNPRWAPLEFTDTTAGLFHGIACDYLERFGKALGVTFRHVPIPSWRQAQAKLREGEVDLLTSLNKASARKVDIEFTTPYQALPTAVFAHENHPPVSEVADLKGEKVAVLAGYGMDLHLKAKEPGLQVEMVYDVPTALRKLESGEVDAFADNLLVTSYYIQRGGHSRIKVAGDLEFVYQPAFAARKDMKILAQILSKALAGIDEQEKNAIARRWTAVTYEQHIDYTKLYKYAAGTLALLGLFFYWNRRMAAEIRRRKAVEASLRKSEEALVAANKELEAFSYSVSHDLRAPLRHVSGFVQLLQSNAKGKLDETGVRYLEVIAGAAKKMGELIDDLLSFSRTGRAQMHLESVPLGLLVEECRRELEPEMQGRKMVWAIGELPEVQADRPLLRQVLANLLGNAVKYTGKREEARIEVFSRREGGEIVVGVKDNGAGFDMKYVDKLFGVFQRLHGENEFEGTGIGLANVRRIIVRHGGRTWAEGEVEQGATFYFTLPAPAAEPGKEEAP